MEKARFKEKLDSMLPDLMCRIREQADHLFESGAVDTETYEDDFRLPKLILTAALRDQAEQYRPLHKLDQANLRNLKRF